MGAVNNLVHVICVRHGKSKSQVQRGKDGDERLVCFEHHSEENKEKHSRCKMGLFVAHLMYYARFPSAKEKKKRIIFFQNELF